MHLPAVQPVVYSTLLEYLRNHTASKGKREEINVRNTAEDFCGVSYRMSYQGHASQTATIAVRSSWPWHLNLDVIPCLKTICKEGPPCVSLTPTSPSSAILAWLLQAEDGETPETIRVVEWLARIRHASEQLAAPKNVTLLCAQCVMCR
jgi:hypothetical protein